MVLLRAATTGPLDSFTLPEVGEFRKVALDVENNFRIKELSRALSRFCMEYLDNSGSVEQADLQKFNNILNSQNSQETFRFELGESSEKKCDIRPSGEEP